jgi:hypothetical protein
VVVCPVERMIHAISMDSLRSLLLLLVRLLLLVPEGAVRAEELKTMPEKRMVLFAAAAAALMSWIRDLKSARRLYTKKDIKSRVRTVVFVVWMVKGMQSQSWVHC